MPGVDAAAMLSWSIWFDYYYYWILTKYQNNERASVFTNKGFPHYNAMFPMMPSQIKGTHAFQASNASTGVAHTLKSCAPVGESLKQPAPPLHTSNSEVDYTNNDNALPTALRSPVHHPPPSVTSAKSSDSNKHKYSALDNIISTSGGPLEGDSSSKHVASKPSGPVALNAVAAQLGEFTSKFEKVMMPHCKGQTWWF